MKWVLLDSYSCNQLVWCYGVVVDLMFKKNKSPKFSFLQFLIAVLGSFMLEACTYGLHFLKVTWTEVLIEIQILVYYIVNIQSFLSVS